MAAPHTQLFAILTSKVTLKNLNNLQKQGIFKIKNLSLTEDTLLEKLFQFVATENVYLDTIKNLIYLFILYFYNP